MYIVPIANDKITTTDGVVYTVSAFNPLYKVDGKLTPAVYILDKKPQEGGIITFDSIVAIKGHAVEFNDKLKLFESAGPFKRSHHIPQPLDNVVIYTKSSNISDDSGIIVGHIKLSNAGHSPSLRIGFSEKGDETIWYDLSQIITIKSGLKFDLKKFKKLYSDYFPFSSK